MAFKYMDNKNRGLNFWEKIYYPEIARGLSVTLRHFFQNWIGKRNVQTKQYPEERFELSYRSRCRHYLTKRSDGSLTCVACMMCAMACPANVITIEIEELDEPYYTDRQKIDRRPKVFTIDQLSCIYCGYCVEACPEDAIRMDSLQPMEAVLNREDAVMTIDMLSEAPVPEHERVYNPLKGQEPIEASKTIIDPKEASSNEY